MKDNRCGCELGGEEDCICKEMMQYKTQDTNCTNIIIKNSEWHWLDIGFFGKRRKVYFANATTFEDLMVELKIYKSRTQARRAKKLGEIPKGTTYDYKTPKTRWLDIWNPEHSLEYYK